MSLRLFLCLASHSSSSVSMAKISSIDTSVPASSAREKTVSTSLTTRAHNDHD
jgi:hypothetical protein